MFFFRHPRPIIDGRAVAVQVVQQKVAREAAQSVLIVDAPADGEPAAAQTPAAAPAVGLARKP